MMSSSNERCLYLLSFVLLLALCNGIDHWKIRDEDYMPYSNFEIDENQSKIVVATVNKIYHLNLNLQEQTDMVEIRSDNEDYRICTEDDLRAPQVCQNYHRLLILPTGEWKITGEDGTVWNVSDTILTCSSNAYNPMCHYRNRISLQSIKIFSGEKFHPYSPFEWIPSLWTSLGKLMVGVPQDMLHINYGITQSDTPFNGVAAVTTKTNRFWINKIPQFVSMYEIGDYIYIFFREEAPEVDERVIYSRVARICKNDTGIMDGSSTIFSTFVKARISCAATSGSSDTLKYHYNEIQSTYYHEEENKLYAIFQSASKGPLGSAMCTFTFGAARNDLDRVFQASYLTPVGSTEFREEPNNNPFTCSPGSRSRSDIISFQLMSEVATPTTINPIIRMDGLGFQKIVVQRINNVDVLFITASNKDTNSLLLLKVGVVGSTYHMIETTTLPTDSDSSHMVTTMTIHGTGTAAKLYIGTETEIYRIPVQECSNNHKSCCECIASRDPYCAYDVDSTSCGAYSNANASSSLVQELTNGDVAVCSAQTASDNVDVTPSSSSGVNKCSGEVNPNTEMEEITSMTSLPAVTEAGLLNSRNSQNFYSFIIVGTVAGFIVGVVIGILVMALSKHFGFMRRRRNKRLELASSLEISNDTKRATIATGHASSKNQNGMSSNIGTGRGQLKEDILRINNTTSSNNLAPSGKDLSTTKLPSPAPPNQYQDHPIKPLKYNSTHSEDSGLADCSPSCCAVETPTMPPPSKCPSPPASSGYRGQGEIFTFTPSCIHYGKRRVAPTTPPYAKPTCGGPYSQSPGQKGGTLPRDPNLQRNYKADIHLTNQQREAYGRNLLPRTPSIDGSKSKYIYSGGSDSRTLPHSQAAGFHRQQDFVHMDAEMGCSQC